MEYWLQKTKDTWRLASKESKQTLDIQLENAIN